MSPEMIETIAVPDTFATGIANVEYAGSKSCVRLYFVATAGTQDIVAAKIVVPASAIPDLIAALRAGVAVQEDETPGVHRLVQ